MLNTLKVLQEKKGAEYVENFLNAEITITEKLDTFRILFEKINDKLIFFKKDNTPLNLIERVLTNIWEDAIVELSIILNKIELPEELRFGVAYTPIERPIRIPYSNIPKYILTDITRRKEGKVVEIFEYDEVEKWTKILNFGRPPIIFKGTLSKKQKDVLLEYDMGNWDQLEETNFSKLIEKYFKKTYSNEEIIEGIILKSGEDLAQIISYEFKLLDESYQKEQSRDFYDLTILRLNSFMDTYNFPILEGETPEELYLEIICNIFNEYCNRDLVSEDLNPNFLIPPNYGYIGRLNFLLIKNKETLKLLEQGGKIYEAIFRVILNSFRKYKKAYGLLNEAATQKFNTYIYLINEKTKSNNVGEIPRVTLLTEDLKTKIEESRSDNIVVKEIIKRDLSDVDNMRIIASIQKAFEPKSPDVKKGKDPCIIYVTNLSPFSNSQLENIQDMNKTWKFPVILCSVGNSRRQKGEKFHFSDQLIKAQMETVADFNKKLIPAFFLIENWDLIEIFSYCRPKYEPKVIITDLNKKSDFVIQLYFEEEVMGGRLSIDKNFNIGEMENKESLIAFRAIEENSFVKFKEVTPQPLWGLFNSLISEFKTWSGQIKL